MKRRDVNNNVLDPLGGPLFTYHMSFGARRSARLLHILLVRVLVF